MSTPKSSGIAITPPKEPMIGVFSSERITRVGFGATSSKVKEIIYYLVRELEDGDYETQPMNSNWLPIGIKAVIGKEQLLKQYMPEPELYAKNVLPQLSALRKALAWGDKYRQQNNYFSAEMEYTKALNLDEDNIRATFGIGICFIERNDMEKAVIVFQKLMAMEATYAAEHKHMFNEFGIALRKGKMYDQAIEYYERAVVLAPDDENLHFNIARAAFHKDDVRKVYRHVSACLKINPAHENALQVKAYLDRKVGPNVAAVLQEAPAEASGISNPEQSVPNQGKRSDSSANPLFSPGAKKGDSGANPYQPAVTLTTRQPQKKK
ncbi:MAG: tetratricopeptide repeat protein [Desulfocurvibacter africanus]